VLSWDGGDVEMGCGLPGHGHLDLCGKLFEHLVQSTVHHPALSMTFLPHSNGRMTFQVVLASSVVGAGVLMWILLRERAAESAIEPQIAVGDGYAIFLSSNGQLSAWGQNDSGQLGDATGGDGGWGRRRVKPVRVKSPTGIQWVKIAAGDSHCLAIQSNGSLWAWGRNDFGQLGDGTFQNRNEPIRIGSATNWGAITAGRRFSLALENDGRLWAWGSDSCGQLGLGAAMSVIHTERETEAGGPRANQPTAVGQRSDWRAISARGEHVLALKRDGSLWAWGRNDWGQLGDGSLLNQNQPIRIGADTNWVIIAAGGGAETGHSVALRGDGTLWVWGNWKEAAWPDGYNGGRPNRRTYQESQPFDEARTRTLLGMRPNSGGKLQFTTELDFGASDLPSGNVPRQLGAGTNWVKIAAGNGYSTAIKSDGSLWGFGCDQSGQTGGKINLLPTAVMQTTGKRRVFAALRGNRDWVGLAAQSEGISYGIKRNGNVLVWANGLFDPENRFVTQSRALLARLRIRLPPHVPKYPTKVVNLGTSSLKTNLTRVAGSGSLPPNTE
jgi:alpha-tubulin suppressor-like RCC1 family protein